jgi:murein tripeptide amidase MpaA
VSPTSGIYTIEQIIQNHINRTNGDLFNEDVVAVDWYIMPLLNPDGYEYSHTNDRMWRKNRTPDLKGL